MWETDCRKDKANKFRGFHNYFSSERDRIFDFTTSRHIYVQEEEDGFYIADVTSKHFKFSSTLDILDIETLRNAILAE